VSSGSVGVSVYRRGAALAREHQPKARQTILVWVQLFCVERKVAGERNRMGRIPHSPTAIVSPGTILGQLSRVGNAPRHPEEAIRFERPAHQRGRILRQRLELSQQQRIEHLV
jgi:hypothetical protein